MIVACELLVCDLVNSQSLYQCDYCAFVCLHWRGMACSWTEMLVTAGVPEAAAEVVSGIYASQDIFQSCFRSESDLDKYLKSMLLNLDPPVATEDTWSFHPASGALRRLRAATVDVSGARARASAQHELQLPCLTPAMPVAQRMTEADREALIKKFGQDYPGVHLHSAVLPSLAYLQAIQQQCQSKAWAWQPWRKVLSEDAVLEMQARKGTKKRDMAELVAEAAGLCEEEWDQELWSSPLKVLHLLSVRAHAYAMCSGGHLYNWMTYVNRFVFHYSKRPAARQRLSPHHACGS